MTEMNKGVKAAIVVGAIAAVVMVTIALLAAYSEVLRTPTNTSIEGLVVDDVNESTAVGTTGQFPFLQTLTGCFNESNESVSMTVAMYTVVEGGADGGVIVLNDDGAAFANATVNCSSIGYLADSTGQASADTFITGVSIFATFIGVVILALLGKIIVGIFRKK